MNERPAMKKAIFLIFFFDILVLSGFGQDNPRVTIVNNTGYTVYYVYMSETTAIGWEEDIMGNDVLVNGGSVNVRLSYPLTSAGRYDIKLVDEDGDAYTKWDVLITPNARIVFTRDDLDSRIADSDSKISEDDFTAISCEYNGGYYSFSFSLSLLKFTGTNRALNIYLNNLLYGGKTAEIYINGFLETIDSSQGVIGGYCSEQFTWEVKGKFLFIKREEYAAGVSSSFGMDYYIIDTQLLKRLTVDDILINTNSQRFKQLIYNHLTNQDERFNGVWGEDTFYHVLEHLEGSLEESWKEKTYTMFYDSQGIGFFWSKYVLGGGADGTFGVIIPWADIWNYLTPAGKELMR